MQLTLKSTDTGLYCVTNIMSVTSPNVLLHLRDRILMQGMQKILPRLQGAKKTTMLIFPFDRQQYPSERGSRSQERLTLFDLTWLYRSTMECIYYCATEEKFIDLYVLFYVLFEDLMEGAK